MAISASSFSNPVLGGAFLAAAAVIAVAGVAITRRADAIADRTGLGEALIGAVLLGGTTSLPGIVTSVSAAWSGYAALSISNALGGIAVQTAFLAVADIFYRKANLEHAAASAPALSESALLMILLAIPLAASAGPEVTFGGIHPATPLLVASYLGGLRLLHHAKDHPMWLPRRTSLTRRDQNESESSSALPQEARSDSSDLRLWLEFGLLAILLGGSGYLLSKLGIEVADRTDLDETAVGGLLTGVVTSLPELVTAVAAVRQGALTLAVSGIIGGNAFDTLFLAFSDVAYREGSIYHQFNAQHVFVISVALLMTGILLLGLLRRQKNGPAGIGFEGISILILYGLAAAVMF
ncbi:MAG TPA: sodium:calcium antiporter [Allosphingosinicella sp.]|nr:sodium:calcium antiporter [Allosphingosinicella sp.]